MNEKINTGLPEVAAALLRLKQKSEDQKKSEEQKRAEGVIKDYACVLGWYTSEDGPIDVECVQRGLVELVREYGQLRVFAERDYQERCTGNTGRGVPIRPEFLMTTKDIGGILRRVQAKYDVERAQKIIEAYRVLEETFENFNEFVFETWREFDVERRNAFQTEVARWEKEKEAFEKGVKEETEQLFSESVKAALLTKNEARLAEGKKKVGVLRFEERYPIERGIRERQTEKKFDKAKPVFVENQAHLKMKTQKLCVDELAREVGKLEG